MNRISFKISEENHKKLKLTSIKHYRSMVKTVEFIIDSFLKNPDKFNFQNIEIPKGGSKKIITIYLEDETYQKLKSISDLEKGSVSRLAKTILDVYFLNHLEYQPVQEKPLF